MNGENEILANVRIFAVEVEGPTVRVDVYGGDDALCGSVGYDFPNARQRARSVSTLRRWCRNGTVLTLVRRSGIVTLLDEAGVLEDLLGR